MIWQPGVTLEAVEKNVILAALDFYQGNKSMAAAALGVTTKTIYNKLESYGLHPKQEAIVEAEKPLPVSKVKPK